jgi:hypothetical protein
VKASEISEQMKIAQESEVDEKLRELDEKQGFAFAFEGR